MFAALQALKKLLDQSTPTPKSNSYPKLPWYVLPIQIMEIIASSVYTWARSLTPLIFHGTHCNLIINDCASGEHPRGLRKGYGRMPVDCTLPRPDEYYNELLSEPLPEILTESASNLVDYRRRSRSCFCKYLRTLLLFVYFNLCVYVFVLIFACGNLFTCWSHNSMWAPVIVRVS